MKSIELRNITDRVKFKIYDEYYQYIVLTEAKRKAENGDSYHEISMSYNQIDVDIYYSRLLKLLKEDGFIIEEHEKPSSWTRDGLYIKFTW